MITMDMRGKVRRIKLRDKLSNSAIAKLKGRPRNTVKKWLKPQAIGLACERGAHQVGHAFDGVMFAPRFQPKAGEDSGWRRAWGEEGATL